jgi:hypothetical protein
MSPINNIRSSNRVKVAIAGVVAAAIGGMVALFPGQKPVHDDTALAVKTLVQPWKVDRSRGISTCSRKSLCRRSAMAIPTTLSRTYRDAGGMRQAPGDEDGARLSTPLVKCITGWDGKPLSWRAMMISLSWNVGTGAACGSTAARLDIAGQYRASCEAATVFNKAGDCVYIGLVNRREMGDVSRIGEAELCVSGL